MQALRDFAAQAQTPLALIECIIADEIARNRLLTSMAQGDHLAGNRNVDLYTQLKAQAEPIDGPKLVIDTGAMSLDGCATRAIDYIRAVQNTYRPDGATQ